MPTPIANNTAPAPAPPAKKPDDLEKACHDVERDWDNDPRLRKWFGYGVRFLVPLACSVLLIWWLFSKVDFHAMMQLIRHGVDYWWIVAMMVITTFSHMIRGARWRLQLMGVGVKLPLNTMFVSIFGAYSLNLVFPRLGEAWRCIFISRRGKVSLSTVVGTDVGDRSSDLVVVIALLIVMIFVAGHAITAFATQYAVGRRMLDIAHNPWVWACIALVVGLTWSFFHFFRNYKFMDKVDGSLHRIWAGFKVLFTMSHKWEYVWLTLGIWTCYYMETYVCFFAFPFTREVLLTAHNAYGFLPGLVAFVFCSISMAIPSNGGLGPWNLAMIFGLSLFGITRTQGAAFAMLMWSAQALMLVILGIYSAIYVVVTGKRGKKPNPAPGTGPDTGSNTHL